LPAVPAPAPPTVGEEAPGKATGEGIVVPPREV
jgi:hypothetical protein